MSVVEAGARSDAGWPQVAFGDVVDNLTVAVSDPEASGIERFVGLDDLDTGSLRVQRWGHVSAGTTFTRRFVAGQVLFGKRRAYQRKAAVADFDGVCSGDILVFQTKDRLDPRLLPYIVQSDAFVDHALATSAGSLSPRTKWSELRKFSFILPPSDEQARLADLFDAATRVSYAAEEAASSTQSVIDAMVAETLDDSDWHTASCDKVLAAGPQNGVSPPANGEERGYPSLSIGAVNRGRVVPDGYVKWVDVERSVVEPFLLKRDDVLVVRGNGNRDLTGRCGVVGDVPQDCSYPDLLVRLVFDEAVMRPAFAALQWNSPVVQRQLMTRAKSTNGIWKVNGKDIKQQTLRVPPLGVQDALLERVGSLGELQRQSERRAADARALLLALIGENLVSA